ncbi:hypothetical protein [Salinisphaera orenii]|uniref:hypothetical protein n=1 Tax=Salinisphaera orenii TaxID=856731 RepID=UPI0011CEC04B|nr:hypothetical protein [Salinisphaera halophila]
MLGKYFFDLPVYRLPRDEYYEQRQAYIDSVIFPANDPAAAEFRIAQEKDDPSAYVAIRDHLERSYGGCWEFNEIIGYIRLHFLGSQVRGDYFAVSKQRVTRTRRNTLEYQTWKLAPEVEVHRPQSREGILEAVFQYIDDCRREVPRRFIDASRFEEIAEFIDWQSLIADQ